MKTLAFWDKTACRWNLDAQDSIILQPSTLTSKQHKGGLYFDSDKAVTIDKSIRHLFQKELSLENRTSILRHITF